MKESKAASVSTAPPQNSKSRGVQVLSAGATASSNWREGGRRRLSESSTALLHIGCGCRC